MKKTRFQGGFPNPHSTDESAVVSNARPNGQQMPRRPRAAQLHRRPPDDLPLGLHRRAARDLAGGPHGGPRPPAHHDPQPAPRGLGRELARGRRLGALPRAGHVGAGRHRGRPRRRRVLPPRLAGARHAAGAGLVREGQEGGGRVPGGLREARECAGRVSQVWHRGRAGCRRVGGSRGEVAGGVGPGGDRLGTGVERRCVLA
ncbi:hypothetical protein PZA11_007457 [Diplocarpon coronariae]